MQKIFLKKEELKYCQFVFKKNKYVFHLNISSFSIIYFYFSDLPCCSCYFICIPWNTFRILFTITTNCCNYTLFHHICGSCIQGKYEAKMKIFFFLDLYFRLLFKLYILVSHRGLE